MRMQTSKDLSLVEETVHREVLRVRHERSSDRMG